MRKIRVLVLVSLLPLLGGCGLMVDSMFVDALECHYGIRCREEFRQPKQEPVHRATPDDILIAP